MAIRSSCVKCSGSGLHASVCVCAHAHVIRDQEVAFGRDAGLSQEYYLVKVDPQKDASMVKLLRRPILHMTTLEVDALQRLTLNLQLLKENLVSDCDNQPEVV